MDFDIFLAEMLLIE